MKNEVEMHAHSYYSDGYCSPTELAREAREKGLKAVCLTDHDTLRGLPEFLEACERFKIDALPGIEISTTYENIVDMHILGYGIDLKKEKVLDEALASNLKMHNKKMEIILRKYSDAGIMDAGIDDLRRIIVRENYPYVSKGDLRKYRFVEFAVPYNQTQDETASGSVACAPAMSEMLMPSVDAVRLIQKTGGKAVLAHPGNYLKKLAKKDGSPDLDVFFEILDTLAEAGLFGIEARHIKQTEEVSDFLEEVAKKRGLFITKSSDYHGAYAPDRPLGENDMSYDDFLEFKEALRS